MEFSCLHTVEVYKLLFDKKVSWIITILLLMSAWMRQDNLLTFCTSKFKKKKSSIEVKI